MKRNIIFIAFLFAIFSVSLFAQDAIKENPVIEVEDTEPTYKMNQAGEQYLGVKLDLNIPYRPLTKLKLGGSGSLGYHYYIFDNVTIGGNISFAYSTTIGNNVFYFVPFMFSVGYDFSVGNLEIPLNLEIGAAMQNYKDRTYFGLAVRPEVGFFYRYNHDWSIGVQTGLYILPQWYKNSEYNYTGLIHDVGLSARYHF